jgi:hypothetical protein
MKNINMLSPSKHIEAILENRKSYNEIEQLREEKKILTQQLVPLQDEAITVIRALVFA